MADAYLRHPTVHGDRLIVTADDDLWQVDLAGGHAHRLTDGRSPASRGRFSPDGTTVAYTSRDEDHPEVFTMPAVGGAATRMTYLGGGITAARGWDGDGTLVVATNAQLPFARDSQLTRVPQPGHHLHTGWGSAHEVAHGTGEDAALVVIGRNTTNLGRWKRYRGGTAGQLWVSTDGGDAFGRILPDLAADLSAPMLIGGRVWFLSDHLGVGNLCSCTPQGEDLTVHTQHTDFYARFAQTDGHTVVYTCGADVWAYSPESDRTTMVDVEVHTPRVQRSRRFADPTRWLQSYDVSPDGTRVAVRVRGRLASMALHDGPVDHHGARHGVNHRLFGWMADGERLAVVADTSGEERVEIHRRDAEDGEPELVVDHDLGVPLTLVCAPKGSLIALTDQHGRLQVVDGDTGDVTEVASSIYGIDDPAWSPDGRWLAYSRRDSNWYTASIHLWEVGTDPSATIAVTDGTAAHRGPAWDPEGAHLYWVAATQFAPVRDGLYFDHGFPFPDVIMCAVLTESGGHPMDREPRAPGARPTPKKKPSTPPVPPEAAARPAAPTDAPQPDADDPTRSADVPDDQDEDTPGRTEDEGTPDDARPDDGSARGGGPTVVIEAEGLADRVVTLPFPGGRYRAVFGLHGKVMAMALPLRPPRPADHRGEPPAPAQLEVLDLDTTKVEVIAGQVSSVSVSADAKTMILGAKKRLRAVRAGVKPPDGPGSDGPARVTGWLDLNRVSIPVDPGAEWVQLFDEAWRLQRDLFWADDLSGVDWAGAHTRYRALVDRIATRGELSDLIWELFGELGTGHAYERGGDHPSAPRMPLGQLGADLRIDEGRWVVDRILAGSPTDPTLRHPLREPGVRVAAGATLLSIDGTQLDETTSPAEALQHRAGATVAITLTPSGSAPDDPDARRTVSVRTIGSDLALRYADWVRRNAEEVAAMSGGRLAYVHIPDMGAAGYAEFHRQYLAASQAEGLVVDVRFNGGGNVSSLLLEKLAGRRIGYQARRTGALEPYPHHAPAGPMVAVTNEKCGSDGDIFTHAWKRMELGPVVGTRTWGGVIGIQPRHSSIEGTVTTQPGFAFWFDDVGWAVENYGTDPTHPVEIAPQDSAAGEDPQLRTAVDLALAALEDAPRPPLPDFDGRPNLRWPPD